jgi:hypothetical protein
MKKEHFALSTPTVADRPTAGYIERRFRKDAKTGSLRWNYGSMDSVYPECDLFRDLLEIQLADWWEELHTRFQADSDSSRNANLFWGVRRGDCRGISRSLADWIVETLPRHYAVVTEYFQTQLPDGYPGKWDEDQKIVQTVLAGFKSSPRSEVLT